MKLKRRDFQDLALLRLNEAQVLFENAHWSGAYLAGYGIECAFKACIAKETERDEFPDRDTVNSSYTHDLAGLLRVAELHGDLREAMRRQPQLSSNWKFVAEWSEKARYRPYSEGEAAAPLKAVRNRKDGILPWLKRHW